MVALLLKPAGESAGGLTVEADAPQSRRLALQSREIVDHRRLYRRVERAQAPALAIDIPYPDAMHEQAALLVQA